MTQSSSAALSSAHSASSLCPFTILSETPAHQIALEDLHAVVFGPGRFARTAYRVRGKKGHDRTLSFVAIDETRIIGGVWQTFVTIGTCPAIFLGPLAVDPDYAGKGCGQALLISALERARATAAGI